VSAPTPAATPPVTRHCKVCGTHRMVSHRQGRNYWVLRYCHHVVTVLISEKTQEEVHGPPGSSYVIDKVVNTEDDD
jgi:hypothetical protein